MVFPSDMIDPDAGYAAARLGALAQPLDPRVEVPAATRAARRLQACLGHSEVRARAEARRCVFHARERRLHETLALEAEPALLRGLVEGVTVDGRADLAPTERGLLFVSLHYGPYSSLLWLVLARMTELAILLDRAADPTLVLPDRRIAELAEAGLEIPVRLDRHAAAPRRLMELLASRHAAVVLADATFLPAGTRRALPLPLGRRTLWLPRGVDWLARQSGAPVAAVWIRPDGGGHRVLTRPAESAAAALEILAREAVLADPAPWEGWLRDQPHF